jgi:hypothetical protein
VLRAVVLVAPVAALLCGWPVGRPHLWFVALTVVLSIGFAAMPESTLGTACLAAVVLWWALRAGDGVPVTAVPAALLLLAAHVAAVLLAYGPPSSPVGAPVARLWLRRGTVVGGAAPLVWLLAVAVDGQPEPPGVWVAGLACAVVLCVVAAVAVGTRDQPV